MTLKKIIQKLRINAFLLFFFPALAIVGSLVINNTIVNINYSLPLTYSYLSDIPGEEYKIDCAEDNDYCLGEKYLTAIGVRIDNCFVHYVNEVYLSNGKEYVATKPGNLPTSLFYLKESNQKAKWALKEEFINNKIELKIYVTNTLNKSCIKNDKKNYFLYKYFPPYSYLVDEKIKGITLGTDSEVNPFLYGEVSISNLVKRHPINIFFKSFLYIGIILMIMYWYRYNLIFKMILNEKKNNFYFFGLGSAVFLFLHVYFLGTTSDSEFLKDFRRIIIVLFILFEVIAQTLLGFKIFNNKDSLSNYCYRLVVLIKIFFVLSVMIFTIVIIAVLSLFNLPSSVDYILEWNYFTVLLIFYLLSSIMWKKINF